ncbi:hypothetical protein BDF22DRAFT_745748 [Syncephalis plumigaleata]|nr:hypothetical protein BDF22DRAFT_745748 [Syncephalis plumigaleata]
MSDEIMEEVSFAVSEELSAIYSNDIDDDNDGDDDDDDDYLDGLPLNISLKNLQAAQGLDYSESEASSDGEAISFIAHSREHSQISEVTLVSDEETIHGNSNNDHSNDNHSSSNTTKTNVVNNKNVTISNSVLDDKMTKTKLPSNNTAIATTTTTTPTSYPPTHGHHRARSIATESARQNHFQMARQFQHNRSQSSSAKSMDGITIQMEGKRVTFREPNPLHPSLRKSSTMASPLSSSSSPVAVQQQSSILPAVASPPRQRQPRSHMVHQSIDETAASLSSNTVQQSHPSQNDNSNGNNNGKNKNNQKSRQRGRGRNQRRNQRRNQQRGGGQQQQQQQHSQQTQVVHG